MTEAEHKRIADRYGKMKVPRGWPMGSHFNKIRSRRCALDSVLDRAEIEALIRDAIALLVESGELPIPPTRGPDPDYGRALCTEQQPTTTRPDDRAATLNR